MADNDAKILKALEALQADVKDLKPGQADLVKGQAELKAEQKKQGKKLDDVFSVAASTRTAVKALDAKVDATRSQLERKINKLPQKAD